MTTPYDVWQANQQCHAEHRQRVLREISSTALVATLDRQRAVKAEYDADPARKRRRATDYTTVIELIADVEAELARRAAASAGTPDGEEIAS